MTACLPLKIDKNLTIGESTELKRKSFYRDVGIVRTVQTFGRVSVSKSNRLARKGRSNS